MSMNKAANNSSSAKQRVAVVGAGYIAEFHVDAIRALKQCEVVAICDLSGARAHRFADLHGIEGRYTDLRTLLAERSPDVVHVLTPPNVHLKPCREALEAGADVLVEKPMCHTAAACDELAEVATQTGRSLGVSHNFLFSPGYERMVTDLRSGRFGHLEQVDITWNKELGQLRGGPFNAWMLANPTNILFEVAPHAFAHAVHLVGAPEDMQVRAYDPFELPTGQTFFRRWEILAWVGTTTVRIRLSFVAGYPEHYIHVRGYNGTARVDFENDTYVAQERTPHLLDIDRFANVTANARDSVVQATGTLARFVLSKAGLKTGGGPFATSITRAVATFHATRGTGVDERLTAGLARNAVLFGEQVAKKVELPSPKRATPAETPRSQPEVLEAPTPSVLVIGGTGFIGQALVRKLREAGHGVRVLARSPDKLPEALRSLGIDAVRGDFTDEKSVRENLKGISHVYHLARGFGNTWPEYLEEDVRPTERLAHACLDAGVQHFVYSSSIAIYDAGRPGRVITELTPPVASMLRANPYARSKVENERILLELHRQRGLPVIIFRPGVVLGAGGPPLHWGIAAWPHDTVCRLYGDGKQSLPIVLVNDVADAMVKALGTPAAIGQSFNLAGSAGITANDYLDEVERRAGIRLKRVPTPSFQAYGEAMVKWAVKSMGGSTASMPSFADWRGRTFASPFDCSKARRELEWSPVDDRDVVVAKGIHAPVDEFFR